MSSLLLVFVMRAAISVRDDWCCFVKPCFHEKLAACVMDETFARAESFREQCFYVFNRFPEVPDYHPVPELYRYDFTTFSLSNCGRLPLYDAVPIIHLHHAAIICQAARTTALMESLV